MLFRSARLDQFSPDVIALLNAGCLYIIAEKERSRQFRISAGSIIVQRKRLVFRISLLRDSGVHVHDRIDDLQIHLICAGGQTADTAERNTCLVIVRLLDVLELRIEKQFIAFGIGIGDRQVRSVADVCISALLEHADETRIELRRKKETAGRSEERR